MKKIYGKIAIFKSSTIFKIRHVIQYSEYSIKSVQRAKIFGTNFWLKIVSKSLAQNRFIPKSCRGPSMMGHQ